MSFKTVFLTVGTDQDDADLDRAIGICQGLGAHLTVLVLGIAAPPPASPYGVVSNDLWAGEIEQGQAAARDRAAEVSARLADKGISCSVEAQFIDRGSVTSLAARFARYSDLTLIAARAARAEQVQTWVMNGALFEFGPSDPAPAQRAGALSRSAPGHHRLGCQRRGLQGGARCDLYAARGQGGRRGADRPGAVL